MDSRPQHRMAAYLRGDEGSESQRSPCDADGLRHGFGIKGVTSGEPLNASQKWLDNAALSTTSIYADAIGPEAKHLAERMWR